MSLKGSVARGSRTVPTARWSAQTLDTCQRPWLKLRGRSRSFRKLTLYAMTRRDAVDASAGAHIAAARRKQMNPGENYIARPMLDVFMPGLQCQYAWLRKYFNSSKIGGMLKSRRTPLHHGAPPLARARPPADSSKLVFGVNKSRYKLLSRLVTNGKLYDHYLMSSDSANHINHRRHATVK